ncbi:odorant receptor 94b-like isoform X1 [Osmia bicornis bicornis]|uniref:odorant receptor 94b-like isoform X1 n=1 Tax=Osmia bicornis bicornis TaxID=1437191 RepID=UPI001EAF75DB|nr:odorant receptor 94b-like isoform X1 [Osmia bicornis bicornis]
MQVMRWTFRLLTMCGCWRPPSWTSPIKKRLYNIYTAFVFTLINTSMILQIMDLVLIVENQDELSENIFLMLTMLVACHKMYSMLMSRKNIAVFNDILENEPFQPENVEEIEIRGRFNRRAEIQAYIYTVVNEMAVIFHSYSGLLKSEKLPYRMWLPYKHLSLTMLIFTYILQALSLMIGSLVHIACDNLIWGMLIHTCSQIEILGYRLKAIKPSESQSAKSSARYHDRVYRFAKMLNKEFEWIVFVQFGVTTMIVCFNLYLLVTAKNINAKILIVVYYTCGMLTQIFIYCWYGNEVKSKSLEVSQMAFRTDWMFFNKDIKRILSMIMRRSDVSIEFTSAHVVSMNLESFVKLLKASYSAFNVLSDRE